MTSGFHLAEAASLWWEMAIAWAGEDFKFRGRADAGDVADAAHRMVFTIEVIRPQPGGFDQRGVSGRIDGEKTHRRAGRIRQGR